MLESLRRLDQLEVRLNRWLPRAKPYQPTGSTSRPSLIDFAAELRPDLDRFDYLGPYAELLQSAIGANLRVAVAAPPQHGKTLLALTALLYWARFFPGKRHAYVTFSVKRAQEVAKELRRFAYAAGIEVAGTLSLVELGGGTTVKFTSVEADLTGYTIDGVGLIDDPIQGRAEAQSPTVRQNAIDWWKSTARTRRHEGTSFIVTATRWHTEDLPGYLVKGENWRYLNFKAIAEGETDAEDRVISDPLHRHVGESIWVRKPPEFFKEEQTDRYFWSAMYQGEPVPRGGNVFQGAPFFYSALPKEGYRGAYGLDLAYTAKTRADWSICVELWAIEGKAPKEPIFYVVDVQRKQVDAPSFALTLKAQRCKRPWPMPWYAAGTEKGAADFLKKQDLPIKVRSLTGDKFVRAQAVAAAWNAGRVLLPDPERFPNCAQWLPAFLDVVQNFTGAGNEHDDDVDALAAAHDELARPSSGYIGIITTSNR